MRVPWTARKSNQSILKEINPEYSLERLMLKLKLQYFGHLIQRANSLEKTLMLGKIEGGRRSKQAGQQVKGTATRKRNSLYKGLRGRVAGRFQELNCGAGEGS